jgi:hypothetical protein
MKHPRKQLVTGTHTSYQTPQHLETTMSATPRLVIWAIPLILLSGIAVIFSSTLENSRKPPETVINFDALDKAATCRNHPYKTHLFSEDPLVIYINSFISEDEASQLVSLR